MTEMQSQPRPVRCPKCERPMRPGQVNTAMWYGQKVVLVEDIPAMVCDYCSEQYYDDETTEGLMRLTEEGCQLSEQTGEVLVPVTNKGRGQGLAGRPGLMARRCRRRLGCTSGWVKVHGQPD
jgi:YgiT-type zinc finger domain-containing protein